MIVLHWIGWILLVLVCLAATAFGGWLLLFLIDALRTPIRSDAGGLDVFMNIVCAVAVLICGGCAVSCGILAANWVPWEG